MAATLEESHGPIRGDIAPFGDGGALDGPAPEAPAPPLSNRPRAGRTGARAHSTLSLGPPNYNAQPVAKLVKTKKRCCKNNPRCKRCPVVCKRLETQGLAERIELRVYKVSKSVGKKDLKLARAR
jgi:hypothetical protein